jgi:hypothetical protein
MYQTQLAITVFKAWKERGSKISNESRESNYAAASSHAKAFVKVKHEGRQESRKQLTINIMVLCLLWCTSFLFVFSYKHTQYYLETPLTQSTLRLTLVEKTISISQV